MNCVKRSLPLLFLIFVSTLTSSSSASDGEPDLQTTWYGHSMFTLSVADGPIILTDPFDTEYYGIRYEVESLAEIDVVTVSHEHEDHNDVTMALGEPHILRGLNEDLSCADVDVIVENVRFRTICSCHFDETPCPPDRGNAVFIIETPVLRIAHLGDLGQILTEAQLEALGPIDILLIPVGGGTTIDADEATHVVQQVKPKVIIPMHYRTQGLYWGIGTAAPFLEGKDVIEVQDRSLTLNAADLPQDSVVYLLPFE